MERVVAGDVEVAAHVRREPGDVVVVDGVAGGSEVGEGGVEVDGVPEGEAVEDQAEGAELVFHAVVVGVSEFAVAAMEQRGGRGRGGLLGGSALL